MFSLLHTRKKQSAEADQLSQDKSAIEILKCINVALSLCQKIYMGDR